MLTPHRIHRHAVVAAAALALIASSPAGAAPGARDRAAGPVAVQGAPVVNWVSPVTGEDMRTVDMRGAADVRRSPSPAARPDAIASAGSGIPFVGYALLAGALMAIAMLATHATAVRRRVTAHIGA